MPGRLEECCWRRKRLDKLKPRRQDSGVWIYLPDHRKCSAPDPGSVLFVFQDAIITSIGASLLPFSLQRPENRTPTHFHSDRLSLRG